MAERRGPGNGHAPTSAIGDQGTGHALTAARRGSGEQTRPQGQTGPRGPDTPPRQPGGSPGTDHAPTAAIRCPVKRPRLYAGNEAKGTGHVSTAARRVPGDDPLPNSCQTGPRGPTTPPRPPNVTQGTGNAATVADGAQGMGHSPTAAGRDPGECPRLHGGCAGPRGQAAPSRWRDGSQGTIWD